MRIIAHGEKPIRIKSKLICSDFVLGMVIVFGGTS